MPNRNWSRWVVSACGIGAVYGGLKPLFVLDVGAAGIHEVGAAAFARAAAGADGSLMDLVRHVANAAPTSTLTIWVVAGVYILAGAPLLTYFGVRYALGALFGGRYGYVTAGVETALYLLVGWMVLGVLSERTGHPAGLFDVAQTGFWGAAISLLAGSITRKVVAHD